MAATLTVATLNLKKGELRWGERAPLMFDQIARLRPDIIGFQEVDLRLDQGNYIWSVRAATAPGVLGAVYRIWNGTASEFRFVENRGGGWMPPRTLAVNQTYYADFDLVYDSDREPVIVYHFETGEVFLQRGGGPAASTTLLFDMANGTEELGVNLRMQIDGADRVHLAYTWDPPDPAPYGEIVAYRFETGTGWQQEEVAQDGLVCGGCGFDFQLDGSGRPYVTHLDKYDETRVFHCEFNGTWEEDDLPPSLVPREPSESESSGQVVNG